MSGITQGLIGSYGASAAPPIPDFSSTVSAYGLFNWNPGGYNAGDGVNYENVATDPFDAAFTSVAPYPLDWSLTGSAPYLTSTWYDQNANANNLTQTGASRPVLDAVGKQITFDGVGTGMVTASALFLG